MRRLNESESFGFIEEHGAKCWDCHAAYDSFPDTVLDDVLWELINPSSFRGGGLLCTNCIIQRLTELDKGGNIPDELSCPIRLDIYIG